jgi:hypothetical protein
MAAIFQIRRGTSNISIADGELYIHQGSGSLQFGSGSNNAITLLPLNVPVVGNINLIGNISASGDVKIGGNIYLGDNLANDSVNVNSPFSGSIIPSGSNIFDLGSSTNIYRNLYVNVISASSLSVPALSLITGSVGNLAYFDTTNSLKTAIPIHVVNSQNTITIGTTAYNGTQPERLMVDANTSYNIATFQTSQQNSYAEVNIKNFGSGSNASADLVIWNDVGTESSSYVDFGINSSNYSAGNVGYGGDGYLINAGNDLYVGSLLSGSHGHLHLFGGNLWQSSSISIYNDGTIGINTDKFNNNISTIPTNGFAVEISGSVKFDNDIFVSGAISSSTISSILSATASLNSYTSSISASLASVNSYTSSLKGALSITGSNLTVLGNLLVQGTTTTVNSTQVQLSSSILTLDAGGTVNGGIYVNDTIGTTATGSLLWNVNTNYWMVGVSGSESQILTAGGMNVISSSTQITNLGYTTTSSFNTYTASISTASIENRFATLASITSSYNQVTASLNAETASIESRFITLASVTGALNTETASIEARFTTLQTLTASYSSSIGQINAETASIEARFLILAGVTASFNTFTGSTYTTFSSSTATRLAAVEYTASILTPSGAVQQFAGLNVFTSSAQAQLTALGNLTASYNQFTASNNNTSLNSFTASNANTSLNAATASYATTGSNQFNGNQTITGSLNVTNSITGSLFGTASYALNGSSNAILYQTASASSTWVFNHFLQTKYPVVTVYDNTDSIIIPQSVTANDSGSLTITFSSPRTGTAVASKGGYVGSVVSSATTATALATGRNINGTLFDGTQNITIPNLVSGSSQISYTGLLNIPAGIVSGSSQILSGITLVSGSSQIDITQTTNYTTFSSSIAYSISSSVASTNWVNISSKPAGLVSGSSQVNFTQLSGISSGIVSSSAQVTPLLPSGVVSGSSQVNFTQLSGISSGIVSSSAQVTPLLPSGVVSGSSQIGNYVATITGTANQITVAGSGTSNAAVTLSLPQNIATTSDVTFNNITASAGIRAVGDIIAYYSSDERLKENITPIPNALSKVQLISGNTYDWKEGFDNIHPHKGNDVGVIAQEIEKVLPQVVINRDNGYKAVDYEKIVPLLIEAIKELSDKIDRLENK